MLSFSSLLGFNLLVIIAFVAFNVAFDALVEYLIIHFLGNDFILLKDVVNWLLRRVFDFLQLGVAMIVISTISFFISFYLEMEPINIKTLVAKIVGEILGASTFLILVLVLYLFNSSISIILIRHYRGIGSECCFGYVY